MLGMNSLLNARFAILRSVLAAAELATMPPTDALTVLLVLV